MISFSDPVKVAEECIQELSDELKPMLDVMLGVYEEEMSNNPEKFLAEAKSHTGFKVVSLVISSAIERGENLPPAVNQWLADYLGGRLSEPKRNTGRPATLLTPLWIVIAVSVCLNRGMKATRNDVSEPVSACDAVAEALENLGLEPVTYEGVKRVWLTNNKRFKFKSYQGPQPEKYLWCRNYQLSATCTGKSIEIDCVPKQPFGGAYA